MSGTHRRLAPSSAYRWLRCPFSARNDIPERPSLAADKGTIAHKWVERVLDGDVDLSDVLPKLREPVRYVVDTVWEQGLDYWTEQKYDSMTIDEYGGTVDILMIDTPRAVIVDAKFGAWAVNPHNNPQLLSYADIVSDHFDITDVWSIIVQPFAVKEWMGGHVRYYKRGSTEHIVRPAHFTREDIEEHHEKVAAAAVSNEKQTGDHCRFCPLRTMMDPKLCPEGRAYGKQRGWDK